MPKINRQPSSRQMMSANDGKLSYEANLRKRQNSDEIGAARSKRRTMQQESVKDFKNSIAETEQNAPSIASIVSNVPIINRSGKIKKIILKNFMSHSNLIVDFNKDVNIFVGNNSSGQSVIITALMIGLGSTMGSETGPISKVTQHIKRGTKSGSVVIHIENNYNGYNRETYGHEIVVERTFSVDGSSDFRIKNASGQLLSTSRDDLMNILLFLNIKVDNPICILDEESSGAFLQKPDPKKLFQFFLKATNIDNFIEKLSHCESHCNTYYTYVMKQLNDQKILMTNTKKDIDDIQFKLNSLQFIGSNISHIKEALYTYELELAWLKVQTEENILKDISDSLKNNWKSHDDMKQSFNKNKKSIANRRAECHILIEQINQLNVDMQGELRRKNQMQQNISKDEEDFNKADQRLKDIDIKLEHNMKNIDQLENDISNSSEFEFDRTGNNGKDERLVYLRQIKSFIEHVRDTVSRDIQMLKKAKCSSEAKATDMREKLAAQLRNKGRISGQIRQWEPRIDTPATFVSVNQRKEHLVDELRGEIVEIDWNISEIVRILEKIDDDIHNVIQIINEIGTTESSGECDKEMLQAQLRELKRCREEHNKERLLVQHDLDKIASAIKVKKTKLKEIDENLREKNGQIDEKRRKFNFEKNLAITEHENMKRSLKSVGILKNNLEKSQKEQQNCINRIRDLKLIATKQGQRIEPSCSYEILLAKIKDTKQMLINSNVSDSTDSLNNVQLKLQEKKNEFEEKKELVEHIEKKLVDFRNQVQPLMTLRHDVSLRMQREFQRIMKLENYDGFIKIDYEKKVLEISVMSTSTGKPNPIAVSASRLSAAERSFSTLAFIFALWSVIDSPFCFLDERGVYMVIWYCLTKLRKIRVANTHSSLLNLCLK